LEGKVEVATKTLVGEELDEGGSYIPGLKRREPQALKIGFGQKTSS